MWFVTIPNQSSCYGYCKVDTSVPKYNIRSRAMQANTQHVPLVAVEMDVKTTENNSASCQLN